MQISPMAQVALLQTEMNSGFRLVPRIGMNSANGREEQENKRLSRKANEATFPELAEQPIRQYEYIPVQSLASQGIPPSLEDKTGAIG